MGLATARESLASATAALFSDPRAAPAGGEGDGASACALCGGSLAPPATAWLALRDFPVCVRSVVTEWRRLTASLALDDTRKDIKKRKGAATGVRAGGSSELRAASMARLCAVLYQCGLLAGRRGLDDREVVAMVVDAMDEEDAAGDRSVLRRVLQQRALARRVRLRVFQYALQATGSTNAWVGDVALALQEELKQASIEQVAHVETSTQKSKKRGRSSMGAFAKTVLCGACETQDATREKPSERGALVDALAKWLQASEADAAVVDSVEGLIQVLQAPEVAQLLQRTNAPRIRPENGLATRHGRTVPSLKVRWDDCDKVAEAICEDVHAAMWRLVWRRERSRMDGVATVFGTLEEVINLCSVADRFTDSTPKDHNDIGRNDVLIGFRVIRTVATHAIKNSNIVVTILRAIAVAHDRKSSAATTLVSKGSLRQTYGVFASYVRGLLDYKEDQDDQRNQTVVSLTPVRRTKSKANQASTRSDLLECVELVHKIIIPVRPINDLERLTETKRRDLFALWFQLVTKIVRDSTETHGSVAAHWSSFLDAIAQCCEELKTVRSCGHVFEGFVCDVLVDIIISAGTRISPPKGCELDSIAIPLDANNQGTLQVLLGLILTANGNHRIVAVTIYRLVVVVARQDHARTQSSKHRQRHGVTIPRLFLTLLDEYFNTVEGTIETALSRVIEIAQSHLQKQYDSHKLTRGFVALLFELDAYSGRHHRQVASTSSHQGDPQRKGLEAACKHGVWQDLVRFYASEGSDCVALEKPAFLQYVSDMLRSIDQESCPSELEGSLFSVVASITSALSQCQVQRVQPSISHSDETILRFIQTFESTATVGDPRDLVAALAREDKLEDLALNLRRWLGILTANRNALSTEAAATLVMLANRLVFWCGPKLSAVEALLFPVDGALLSALQLFSASSPSSTPQISVVRLSVMTRAYLSVNTPPNLVALTSAVIDATLNCSSASARDGLLKLIQSFAAFLVVEVISDRLRTALLQVDDRASAKSVRNALVILSSGPRILRARSVGFSLDVFSVATAEKWVSAIVLVGLSSESSAKAFGKTVESFLVCLETLIGLSESDQDATVEGSSPSTLFQRAYVLDAFLSTVLLGLLGDGISSSMRTRIKAISQQLRSHLLENVPVAGGSHSIGKSDFLLMIDRSTCNNQLERKHLHPVELICTSSVVFVDRRGTETLGVSPVTGEVLRPVKFDSTEVHMMASSNEQITTQWHLTFSSWITSALIAQQQAPSDFANAESYAAWEFTFTEMVHQFYLPVQFDGDTDLLTADWLSTWINQCLVLAHCIDLLQFQRSMLLDHLAAGHPWIHLTRCTKMLMAHDVLPAQGSKILNHVVRSLDLVVLSSARLINSEDIGVMANDVNTMLEHICQSRDDAAVDPDQCLATIEPLIEAFVRASLRASVSSTHRTRVIDCVKRVGLFMQQLLARSESSAQWWSECLEAWKRRLSHLNRRDAPQIIEALQFQVCDLTGSDDDTKGE